MFEIEDRVYNTKFHGNGIIINHHNNDQIKGVAFFWRKYKPGIIWDNPPEPLPKGTQCFKWVNINDLVKQNFTFKPEISMIGKAGVCKLLRRVCEIKRRKYGDDSKVVINYGVSNHRVSRNIKVVNRNLVSNKFEQCKRMINFGVSVPPIETALRNNYIFKPCFSMGGKYITDDLNNIPIIPGYFQKKINKKREFRAHVFLWNNDPVPLIQEKVCNNPKQLCWNKKQGGKFRYVKHPISKILDERFKCNLNTLKRISKLAVKACKALSYDFGGVDIIMDKANRLYVIEVNSRMGAREKTIHVYKEIFNKLY